MREPLPTPENRAKTEPAARLETADNRFLPGNSGWAPASPAGIEAVENNGAEWPGRPETTGGQQARTTVGIDLGGCGALALVDSDGRLIAIEDMPVLPDGPKARPTVNAALLAELLRRWEPDRAFVEFVSARPTDGSVGAFAFGKARGHVEAALATLGVPMRFITAPVWKRTIGIPPGTGQKNTARAEAIRRWPAHAGLFSRVKDDGRAEAALIAVAGMAREAQGR